jgi:uncharacterized protein (TIGR02466 family)
LEGYEMKVLPLFATPMGIQELTVDSDQIEQVLESLSYQPINVPMSNRCSVSTDFDLLKKPELQDLRDKILSAIQDFSVNYVGSKPAQFRLERSWATRTQPGESSAIHNHMNSMYSAVFYNRIEPKRTAIKFFNFQSPRAYDLGRALDTPFNTQTWTFFPQPQNLIIFPAYLYHTILENMGSQVRYSIACNFNPTGNYGFGDSEIKEDLL